MRPPSPNVDHLRPGDAVTVWLFPSVTRLGTLESKRRIGKRLYVRVRWDDDGTTNDLPYPRVPIEGR